MTGAEADWEAIETLGGKVDPAVQVELMAGVDGLVDAVTRWYLSDGMTGHLGETFEAGRDGFVKLATIYQRDAQIVDMQKHARPAPGWRDDRDSIIDVQTFGFAIGHAP